MTPEKPDDIGFLLKRIHNGICRSANNGLRPMDLTLTQMRVMGFIACQESGYTTQREIEARFGVSHPTVVGIIKRLESKELIRTEMDRNDRRVKNIFITPQGERFMDACKENRERMEHSLVSGLNHKDQQELRRLLLVLVNNVCQRDEAEGCVPERMEAWKKNERRSSSDV